ncbi:MAG: energy-coupling factor ABC transporter substrate-binding protein [Romboutsia sp.]
MSSKSKTKQNIILLGLTILLIIFPLVFNKGAEYGGADGEAEDLIGEVAPDYEPWFSPLYEPPSGEIESLLFSVQAALGSGGICYYLGYRSGKKSKIKNIEKDTTKV